MRDCHSFFFIRLLLKKLIDILGNRLFPADEPLQFTGRWGVGGRLFPGLEQGLPEVFTEPHDDDDETETQKIAHHTTTKLLVFTLSFLTDKIYMSISEL